MRIRVEMVSGRSVSGTVVNDSDAQTLRSCLALSGGIYHSGLAWFFLLQDDRPRLVNFAHAETITELPE